MKNHTRTLKINDWIIILFIGAATGLSIFYGRLPLIETAHARNLQAPQPLELQPPIRNINDEAAIRVVYQQVITGWNKGSGASFAAAFTEDADLVGFDGTHLKGRKEIASFHQQLFDTFLKGSRLEGEVKGARFLDPDVVVMHAISRTVMPDQIKVPHERDSMQTLVFTKRDGQWRIAALQNSRLILDRESASIRVDMRRIGDPE